MNTTEKYALSCGVRIKRPKIGASYFPLKFDKYIVIDNRNKYDSNVYSLYSDVVSYLYPVLEKEGIKIVSFCKDVGSGIDKTSVYVNLTKKQESYIIENSLLLIGSDNISNHLADIFDIPSVGLYSAFPSEVSKPIYSAKHHVIESERQNNLPSYGVPENPKAIDFIEPEKIAQKVLDILDIDFKINHETIYLGDLYATKVVEVVPNFVADVSFMNKRALNIRMDKHFDEQKLCHWLNDRYLNIMTDRPISLDILRHFKKNIAQFTVNINKDFDQEYLKNVQEIGIKLEIFCEDEKNIENLRFQFFDFDVHESFYKSVEDLKNVDKNGQIYFLSSKIILSEGQKYSCYSAERSKKPLTGNVEMVYDDPDFWKECDYYRLLRIN